MPQPPVPAPGRRGAPRRRRRVGAVALVVAALLAGCGVRLETPPPEPLVADEVESARQRTTAHAVSLGVLAEHAVPEAPAEAVEVLQRVSTVSEEHMAALGGLYEPGTADRTSPASPESPGSTQQPPADGDPPAPPPPPGRTPQEVVALLTESAASARADAASVPDGPLARLLASVAAGRLLLADALAAAAGLDDVFDPEPFEVPQAVPAGLGTADLSSLVQSEDAAGMAWEVLAARSSGDGRRHASAQSAQHRDRAETWALLADIAGTGLDPRRAAYDLPDALIGAGADLASARDAVGQVERDLAATYASLVATAEAGERSPLVDALVETSKAGVVVTGTVPTFPGLPERSG